MNDSQPHAFRQRLDDARLLHRRGELEPTRRVYEALYRENPQDADLVGLMAILALQQRDPAKAEALLLRALELPATPRIRLRNLNNALALMKEQRRVDEARALIGDDTPEWPRGTAPEASERATLLSLAAALSFFGRPEKALSLMETVLPELAEDDAEALSLAGRLALEVGNNERAVLLLEQVARSDASDWRALAALSAGYAGLARTDMASEAAVRAGSVLPLYVAPDRETQRATILVLNDLPRNFRNRVRDASHLHFRTNYISQLALRASDRYRFASFFGDVDGPLPQQLPGDILFNNMASPEQMNVPGRLEHVRSLVDRIGLPVINHPDGIFRVTRQKIAERLRGIPGLRIPKIARYRRDAGLLKVIVGDIESAFNYPFIVRHVAADSSSRSLLSERKTALLINDRNELHSFVEEQSWPEFYVVEYVDLRKSDGSYRKLRAMLFPDEVIIGSGGFYSEWMVGGWRHLAPAIAYYDANPHLLEEMNRILLDPVGLLGPQVLPVLEQVRERIPLDVSGMDFDVDDEGRLVLFEAGSTMNFLQRENTPRHHRMPEELDERIDMAFDRLVASRIG